MKVFILLFFLILNFDCAAPIGDNATVGPVSGDSDISELPDKTTQTTTAKPPVDVVLPPSPASLPIDERLKEEIVNGIRGVNFNGRFLPHARMRKNTIIIGDNGLRNPITQQLLTWPYDYYNEHQIFGSPLPEWQTYEFKERTSIYDVYNQIKELVLLLENSLVKHHNCEAVEYTIDSQFYLSHLLENFRLFFQKVYLYDRRFADSDNLNIDGSDGRREIALLNDKVKNWELKVKARDHKIMNGHWEETLREIYHKAKKPRI